MTTPQLGDTYMWAPPGKVPKRGKVTGVSSAKVLFNWEATAKPETFLLPLDEFFFKIEEAEND